MIPLTKPYIDSAMKKRFFALARTANFSETKHAEAFAGTFAKKFSLPYALCINSCTDALVAVLVALGVKRNDRVMVPAYTCKAVFDALMLLGIVPVFIDNTVDYERSNFNLDEDDCVRKITSGVKALILPYMFGYVPRYEKLERLSIPIIEDITLSLGAPIQNFAYRKRIIVSSFHSSKMISAFEGGIIATSDEALYKTLQTMCDIGKVNKEERLQVSSEIGYQINFSFRPSELNFMWGRLQLQSLARFVRERQRIARAYISRIDGAKYALPKFNDSNVYFRFIVGLKRGEAPKAIAYLAKKGIEAGRGVYPLLSVYVGSRERLPGAEKAIASSLSFPLYPGLKKSEIDAIVRAANAYEG